MATILASSAAELPADRARTTSALAPIDTAGFRDSANHWRNIRDTNRFIQALPQQPTYTREQVREIAANILLFQRENGGWPKDYDMLAILTKKQSATVLATKGRHDTSFDNHNVHAQVDYLARAFAASGEPAWRQACERGLDFMLAAQMPNGGFPQRYPSSTAYSAHITFNDGVMIGILSTLEDAADRQPQWTWLDATRRDQAQRAVQLGVDCILKCQIRVEGQWTGWCQQHDEKTCEARPARTFELASICPQDSTEIVRFLMRLKSPNAEVVRAVEAAVGWLRRVQLSGVRVERIPAPKEEFLRHTADYDVVVVQDPQAAPLWARHYEIGTDRPVFAGRGGVRRYVLSEVERERRTGSAWYGNWPQQLLETEYPKWRADIRQKEGR